MCVCLVSGSLEPMGNNHHNVANFVLSINLSYHITLRTNIIYLSALHKSAVLPFPLNPVARFQLEYVNSGKIVRGNTKNEGHRNPNNSAPVRVKGYWLGAPHCHLALVCTTGGTCQVQRNLGALLGGQ